MRLENPQHETFCLQYVKNNFNGKQAAIFAGYSPKTAESQASRLLRTVKVKNRLKEIQDELAKTFGIDMQEIVDSIKQTKELAKAVNDLTNALKSDDMLIKIIGGYATEKTKTDLQFLDKNGIPTEPPTTTINKSYFTKKDVQIND